MFPRSFSAEKDRYRDVNIRASTFLHHISFAHQPHYFPQCPHSVLKMPIDHFIPRNPNIIHSQLAKEENSNQYLGYSAENLSAPLFLPSILFHFHPHFPSSPFSTTLTLNPSLSFSPGVKPNISSAISVTRIPSAA